MYKIYAHTFIYTTYTIYIYKIEGYFLTSNSHICLTTSYFKT